MTAESIAVAANRYHAALEEADDYEWRPGHSDPQNVYARMGTRADQKDDPKVLRAESPQHARRIVKLHNDDLARRKAEEAMQRHEARVTGGSGLQFGHGNTQYNNY